ncbi:MAG: hypothetical protein E7570_05595 [Ruminococcaceae bacterium]|nr:hypothetical protein [Oscillospiraceae bacterium]
MAFYINKTQIIIEYSFLLVIAFTLLSGSYNILYVILFSSLHETAHLISLLLFKGDVKRIRIAFYGMGLEYKANLSFICELLFLISGVTVNFAISALNIFREINYSLAIINLLPLYPLDGGRALKLILNKLFNLNVSDLVFRIISFAFIAAMIIYIAVTRNIQLLIITIYIIVFSFNNTTD